MGLLFSAILSYAGALEAIECLKHILAGMLPDSEPDFEDLVQYYTSLLQARANPHGGAGNDWTRAAGQGYLCLLENTDGSLKSAAVKYYDGSQPDSTAILFSTKISSFGQDSVDSNTSHANGYGKKTPERYNTATTTTIISNSSESFSIGQRNRSSTPTCEHVSDSTHFLGNSFERSQQDDQRSEISEGKEKLTWHYRPKSPVPQALPEIHFQTENTENKSEPAYSEDFLRSLDGIKYRPLQRSDPSNRRRSYKKRHSSSSTSSKDSRASREEELKIFTSLEEAEFERMGKGDNSPGFGSTPNLAARSYSRSRSRENSKERRNESWSLEQASVDSVEAENKAELKPPLKDLPKLGSFEEELPEAEAEVEPTAKEEVTAEDEEVDDFWGSSD